MDWVSMWFVMIVATIVLNLIPAFMPPTWVLLAWFHINEGVPIWQLAIVGAVAAAIGRGMLAMACRRWGIRILPERWRANIEELGIQVQRRRVASISAIGVFLLSPIPSNQLFIALGIARVPLALPLAAFVIGRGVGYTIWISAAGLIASSLADTLKPSMGSTFSIVAQIAGVGLLILVMQVEWKRFLPSTP